MLSWRTDTEFPKPDQTIWSPLTALRRGAVLERFLRVIDYNGANSLEAFAHLTKRPNRSIEAESHYVTRRADGRSCETSSPWGSRPETLRNAISFSRTKSRCAVQADARIICALVSFLGPEPDRQ